MAKQQYDWEAIERDYRAGVLTLRAMATQHGISDVAILKRAKRDGWARDLKARIRAKAAEKVSKLAVSAAVNKAANQASDQAVVEANAQMQTEVILAHRTDVRRSREICRALIEELGAKSLTEAQLQSMVEAIDAAVENPKARDAALEALMKSLDLGSRAVSMQRLAGALDTLIKAERLAFGIDDADKPGGGIEDLLNKLGAPE